MDILYIVGEGSTHNNIELRMSLRSISRFGKGIGKVIVAGRPPMWLSDDVEKVIIPDRYSYKHLNILNCLEEVVKAGLVKGDFLYSSDDHFYVKHVDFANYPVYVKGELRDFVTRTDPYYEYHKSLCDTRQLCEKHHLPTINYSQHCNTHMNAEVISEIKDIIKEAYGLKYGVEPTSLIMNAWQQKPNAPKTTTRLDVKINYAKDILDLYQQISCQECFSISDSIFKTSAIKDFFNREYSIKSIFEAD